MNTTINDGVRHQMIEETCRAENLVAQGWLKRNVHSLLGLPIDAVSMAEALAVIRQAVERKERLFLSTPNVNFAMAARNNPAFRRSVLASDLSVADGMPMVWIARLTGLPIKERVAGADLFEQLLSSPGPTIKVYLFGGPDGAAQAAAEFINRRHGSVQCVGWCSPGFQSAEALSEPSFIDTINASGADMVVVSLGAAKGQEWIMRNRDRLDSAVLTHLGAVVNFVAGTVARAPGWMRKSGLEWIWRIMNEPALWRRYWSDGTTLLTVLINTVTTRRSFYQRHNNVPLAAGPENLGQDTHEAVNFRFIGLSGEDDDLKRLRQALAKAVQLNQPLQVDVLDVTNLPPAILGMLQIALPRIKAISFRNAGMHLTSQLYEHGLLHHTFIRDN